MHPELLRRTVQACRDYVDAGDCHGEAPPVERLIDAVVQLAGPASNPQYESWQQVSAGAADSHAVSGVAPTQCHDCKGSGVEETAEGPDNCQRCQGTGAVSASDGKTLAAAPAALSDEQIQKAVFALLRRWKDDRAWDRYTRESGPYDVTSLRPEVLEIIRAAMAVAAPPLSPAPAQSEDEWLKEAERLIDQHIIVGKLRTRAAISSHIRARPAPAAMGDALLEQARFAMSSGSPLLQLAATEAISAYLNAAAADQTKQPDSDHLGQPSGCAATARCTDPHRCYAHRKCTDGCGNYAQNFAKDHP